MSVSLPSPAHCCLHQTSFPYLEEHPHVQNSHLLPVFPSQARQEMGDSHGGGGPVASLDTAVLAEGNIEALVNKRLVGVVVIGQQSLSEFAFVDEDSLKKKSQGRKQRGELSKSPDSRRMNITTYARFACDLYFGRPLAYKACLGGNRRRWHVVAKEMPLSKRDTSLLLLPLKISSTADLRSNIS